LTQRFRNFRNTVATLSVFGFTTSWIVASHAQSPIPVEDFFKRPAISAAVLSPSGRYVAATMRGGLKNRNGLVILDMIDSSKSKGIAAFADADVSSVRWVNDDRLVFTVFDSKATYADQKNGGLFVVDRSGKDGARNLIRRELTASESDGVTEISSRIPETGLSVFHRFYSVLRDGTNDVIVSRNNVDSDYRTLGTSLLRLNTSTGKAKLLTADAPNYIFNWALDHQGNARAALSSRDGKSTLHLRVTPEAPWTQAASWNALTEGKKALFPIIVDNKNQLYVEAQQTGTADTTALAKLDMASPTLERKVLLALDGFDFDGSVNLRTDGSVLGVNYLTDAQSTHWFDADFKAAQAKIDGALKGRVNILDCGGCANAKSFLVSSFSDQQPSEWYYFDAATNKLSLLEKSRPWIKADMMATREMLRFPARDGLSIPVHITTPKGIKGPFPTVVLVHGGPNVRGGEWRWEAESQFLASRGYLVIEPEFRGSTGFGAKHFASGWKQWGLAMQDDLADATQWAIKKGLSDPKRVAIAGSSYGGYAAMMGLIKNPELFKVGVNWVGVSDIDLMYTARWSDTSRQWKDYDMPVLVGDRVKDREQFILTSPLKQAAKLTQPILMAYGDEDTRVPIAHGYAMRDALKKHNNSVEWITYKDEGHGWVLESNNIDFWTRVAKFLDTNLVAK
jgi:dipeptidyl aminopeptidase/acylaminoacyl peptidase